MLLIFLQSALPAELSKQESGFFVVRLAEALGLDEDLVSFIVRKGAHFTEYLLLGISLFLTVRDLVKKECFRFPWVIGAVYAVSDEVHQYFVPGRSCEMRDVVIDACGVLAGVSVCWLVQKRRQPEKE